MSLLRCLFGRFGCCGCGGRLCELGAEGSGDDCVCYGYELVAAVPTTAVALEILRRCTLNHAVGQVGLGVDGALVYLAVVLYLAREDSGYFGAVDVFLCSKVFAKLAGGLLV